LTDYDTLVYACCQCNAARGAILLPLDPTAGLRQHLEVSADGTIRGLTLAGEDLIRICRLRGQPHKRVAAKPVLVPLLFAQPYPADTTELRLRMRAYFARAVREWIQGQQQYGDDFGVAP
jgi:hypothetical protein